jgi:hypothetical protein
MVLGGGAWLETAAAAVTVEAESAWVEPFFEEVHLRAQVRVRSDEGRLLGVQDRQSQLQTFQVDGVERLQGGWGAPYPEGFQHDGPLASHDPLAVRLGAALPPPARGAEVLLRAELAVVLGFDPEPLRVVLPARGSGELRCGAQRFELDDDPYQRGQRRLRADARFGLSDLRLLRAGEEVDLSLSTSVSGTEGQAREEATVTFARGPARQELVLEATCYRRLEVVQVPLDARLPLRPEPPAPQAGR